jgi:peptide/nickel transport system permease protein
MGATGGRIVTRHLLPSILPFLGTQAVLLLPAFIVAEATLSFIGLGFAEPTPSWGTLLSDTFDVRVLREAPWLLAPAVAIALVTVAANLVREGKR